MPSSYPIAPPIEPMLAKLAGELPIGAFLYEPKWDGFRAIVFRGESEVFIQSRDLRPLDRYFPELHEALGANLPAGCVVDGEIVIATPHGLDFEALQLRLHPAASRVARLAKEMPAGFVAFDALAVDGRDLRALPQAERRLLLERALVDAATSDPPDADDARSRRGGGVALALRRGRPRRRDRQAGGCALRAGEARDDQGEARAHRRLRRRRLSLAQGRKGCPVGSLLLGLYDDRGALHHVGVTSAFTMAARSARDEFAPLREHASTSIRGANGQTRWLRRHADARRAEPLECGQGSVLGTVADRARLRGQVRSHAGRSLSPRGALSVRRPDKPPSRLPLRPARGHDAL